MAIAYQYDADGYFVGLDEDHGLLPNNATYAKPVEREGHIPRWNGKAWVQVEDHKGKEGFVDGEPFTIKEYGPLPEDWADTPPEPTPGELAERRKAEIMARLAEIDTASVRPLRAIAQGEAMQEDSDKLAVLDAEAAALRLELAALAAA